MKTLKQIREAIEVNEAEDKKLTTLIRAGLFDVHKLPLLKRALSKDNTKMSPAERNSLLDLLDTLIAHVTGDNAIYGKVRRNVMAEENVNEVYEVAGELPMILILKRRSIRSFPDGQRVALYWADKLKTFISVPYSSVGVGYSPAVSEEVVLVAEEPLDEISKNKANKYISQARGDKQTVYANSMARNDDKNSDDFYDDPHDVEDEHRLNRRNTGIDLARSKINKFGKTKVKATEEIVDETKKPSDFAGFAKQISAKDIKIRPEAVYRSKSSGLDALPKQVRDAMEKKKEVKEGDVQELSKKTLSSYVKKASDDVSYHSFAAGDYHGSKDKSGRKLEHDKKAFSRQKGVEKAVDKIVKENLETLQAVVNENEKKLLNFLDGTEYSCGAFTASAILEVYNAINDDNKAKMKASLNESKVSFMKMAEFALSKV